MTTKSAAKAPRTYDFGQRVYFINPYGQEASGLVIADRGDFLDIDYRNCLHTIPKAVAGLKPVRK